MKILYLVNNISKTSIPWRWSEFFNNNSSLVIEIKSINNLGRMLFNIKKNIDIVHGHHVKSMFLFLLVNVILDKKTVYTVHGSYLFLSKINIFLLKYIFKKTNKVLFVNKKLHDVLPLDMKKSIEGKYEIILNGVELNYDYKKKDVYKKYNINNEDTILFHPARFVTEKNHIRIISAFKSIAEKNKNIRLVLAGDGQLEDEIKDHIKKLNLTDYVILLGLIERDEVYNFLENCDLFLMPSLSEGLNISFLEAISMHCKVIVSDIEQFTYPIKSYGLNPDEINVGFINPLDEKDIEQGITSILKKKQSFSYNASDFSLDTMMKKYKRVYKELS